MMKEVCQQASIQTMKKLIVGLGNPGTQHLMTRHNIGFMCLDFLQSGENGLSQWKKDKKSFTATLQTDQGEIIFCKPTTFMNLSGDAVIPIVNFYQISWENVLVIHDDLNLHFGEVKLKKGGGTGGHNGLRDLIQKGSPDFYRLRFGIGHPGTPHEVHNFVLGNFSHDEQKKLKEKLMLLEEKILEWVSKQPEEASDHQEETS